MTWIASCTIEVQSAGSNDTEDCTGALGCSCTAGAGCDVGLICEAQVCVSPDDASGEDDSKKQLPACVEETTQSCGTDVGVCEFGLQTCHDGAFGECEGSIEPADELCGDSLDDNCDGSVDEGFSGAWVLEALALDLPLDAQSSLAVDSEARLHIAVAACDGLSQTGDCEGQVLSYGLREAGEPYEFYTLDDAGKVGEFASLALDATGQVHIVYYDRTQGDLKYIVGSEAAGFATTVVDSSGDAGRGAALVLDTDSLPHISYVARTDDGEITARYATRVADGSFQVETIDVGVSFEGETALSKDAFGTVHVAYVLASDSPKLRYGASVSAGNWTLETVTSVASLATQVELRSDSSGAVQLLFADGLSLVHAYRLATGWTREVLASGSLVRDPVLALDAAGGLYVAYVAGTDLWYLRQPAGAAWNHEQVLLSDGSLPGATKPSLFADSLGGIRVTFCDADSGTLWDVYRCP